MYRTNPTTEEIKEARSHAGLSQQKAADMVHSPQRSWQSWEYGISPMHPAIFELFVMKSKALVRRNKKRQTTG